MTCYEQAPETTDSCIHSQERCILDARGEKARASCTGTLKYPAISITSLLIRVVGIMSESTAVNPLHTELIEAALRGMRSARILWGFPVGAAVLGDDNRIYEGCNVESEVAGLGVCAERCAIDHAVVHGVTKIRAVAVVAEDQSIENLAPCGACRQYIKEFADGDLEIVSAMAKDGSILGLSKVTRRISELLPFPFRTSAFYIQTRLSDHVK